MSHYTIRPTSVGALARGGSYTVRDLGNTAAGYTNLLEKELGVSLNGDSPETRWTQIHELAHVKHSLWQSSTIQATVQKKLGRTVAVGSILAAEDARINELVTRAVTDAHEGFKLSNETRKTLRTNLEGYVACHGEPPEARDALRMDVRTNPTFPDHVLSALDAKLSWLASLPSRELTVWGVTVPLALALEDAKQGKGGSGESGDTGQKGQKGKPEPGDGKAQAGKAGEESKSESDKSESGDEESDSDKDESKDGSQDTKGDKGDKDEEALGKPDAGSKSKGSPHAATCSGSLRDKASRLSQIGEGNYVWAIPEVIEPELSVVQHKGNFSVMTAETGPRLRWSQLHRINTDGVVFARNRRRPGALQRGTVLIDASTSVSLTIETIDALVTILPHATIAMYSGRIEQEGGKKAWIVVLARDGKRVPTVSGQPRGGWNTCDGPALLWLSRQPGPRLWICDGSVNGSRGHATMLMEEECQAIMTAAGIVQVRAKGYRQEGLVASKTLRYEPTDNHTIREGIAAVLKNIERGIIEA